MLLPHPRDAVHKAWLCRILTALADDIELLKFLRFKGGTCAAMLDYLDRFSVDLDFDLEGTKNQFAAIRKRLERRLKLKRSCFWRMN
ncbi:MAG: nucleotidyl transferase AbiEii/AbiGii toxin family protein [Chlamydiae bacterium]|nr:nucleotidyl transferase AbiEii/AbiGii toxin family protein [Chlamydiota bacterium]